MNDKQRFGFIAVITLSAIWLISLVIYLVQGSSSSLNSDLLSLTYTRLIFWTLTVTVIVLWCGIGWQRWRATKAPIPELSIEQLQALDPTQFEEHVAHFFRRKGFKVHRRGRTGDHGVDLEVYSPNQKMGIVQCKRYRSTVGEGIIRELFGSLVHEGASHAYLVTPSNISDAARNWAESKPITLVDGTDLIKLTQEINQQTR
ncbi:MAG: restriction endonuclease, partial [Chloroflexota bacterium]